MFQCCFRVQKWIWRTNGMATRDLCNSPVHCLLNSWKLSPKRGLFLVAIRGYGRLQYVHNNVHQTNWQNTNTITDNIINIDCILSWVLMEVPLRMQLLGTHSLSVTAIYYDRLASQQPGYPAVLLIATNIIYIVYCLFIPVPLTTCTSTCTIPVHCTWVRSGTHTLWFGTCTSTIRTEAPSKPPGWWRHYP